MDFYMEEGLIVCCYSFGCKSSYRAQALFPTAAAEHGVLATRQRFCMLAASANFRCLMIRTTITRSIHLEMSTLAL